MKALQLTRPQTVELVEIPRPAAGAHEVLILTGASTICTSDVIDIRSNPFGIALPVIMGHEGAGTVAALGPEVGGLTVGDRVAAHPVHPCGRCRACQTGTPHLCLDMGHFGVNMQGTFADYFVARADRVRPLPPDIDVTVAALAEPVCVCLEALAQARLTAGQALLIIGDGPFGLIMARLAALRDDIGTVVLAGQQEFRLTFADVNGIRTVNTAALGDDQADALRKAGDGLGYDAVILAVDSRPAISNALSVLKPRGRLVLFAAVHGDTPLDLATVHRKELEIVGSCNDDDLLDDALDLLGVEALGLAQLVTHRFPITAYREALSLAATGQDRAVKVAFVF